jgi:hypothetical protein
MVVEEIKYENKKNMMHNNVFPKFNNIRFSFPLPPFVGVHLYFSKNFQNIKGTLTLSRTSAIYEEGLNRLPWNPPPPNYAHGGVG